MRNKKVYIDATIVSVDLLLKLAYKKIKLSFCDWGQMSSNTVLEGDRTHYPYRNPLQIYAQRCIDKIHLFLTCNK